MNKAIIIAMAVIIFGGLILAKPSTSRLRYECGQLIWTRERIVEEQSQWDDIRIGIKASSDYQIITDPYILALQNHDAAQLQDDYRGHLRGN